MATVGPSTGGGLIVLPSEESRDQNLRRDANIET
jgi:hypothetical protein